MNGILAGDTFFCLLFPSFLHPVFQISFTDGLKKSSGGGVRTDASSPIDGQPQEYTSTKSSQNAEADTSTKSTSFFHISHYTVNSSGEYRGKVNCQPKPSTPCTYRYKQYHCKWVVNSPAETNAKTNERGNHNIRR